MRDRFFSQFVRYCGSGSRGSSTFLRSNCKVLAELKTYNLIASLDVPFLFVRYNQHLITFRGIVGILCILFLKRILFLILGSNERLLIFDGFKDRVPVVQRKIELVQELTHLSL